MFRKLNNSSSKLQGYGFGHSKYKQWIMLQSAKSKLRYKPKGDGERLKVAFSKAISGLQTAVRITKSIASDVGLGPPGLQTGLGGLLLVLTAIQVSSYGTHEATNDRRIEHISKCGGYRTTGNENSNTVFDPSKIAKPR